MYNFTVRRHLSKGEHYGWWQIRECISKSKQGKVIEYVDPSSCSILFKNCYLYNRPNTAQKIFDGAYKAPCAWICFDEYEKVDTIIDKDNQTQELSYNPKKAPNWEKYWDFATRNVDKHTVGFIYSVGTKLYI